MEDNDVEEYLKNAQRKSALLINNNGSNGLEKSPPPLPPRLAGKTTVLPTSFNFRNKVSGTDIALSPIIEEPRQNYINTTLKKVSK